MVDYKIKEAKIAEHKDTAEIATMGAAAGTAAGAGVGMAVGGPAGAIIGAAIGALTGGLGASATINDADDVAKQMEPANLTKIAGDTNGR